MEDVVYLLCETNFDDEDKSVQLLKKFTQSHSVKDIALSEPPDTPTTFVVHFMLRAARVIAKKKTLYALRIYYGV